MSVRIQIGGRVLDNDCESLTGMDFSASSISPARPMSATFSVWKWGVEDFQDYKYSVINPIESVVFLVSSP